MERKASKGDLIRFPLAPRFASMHPDELDLEDWELSGTPQAGLSFSKHYTKEGQIRVVEDFKRSIAELKEILKLGNRRQLDPAKAINLIKAASKIIHPYGSQLDKAKFAAFIGGKILKDPWHYRFANRFKGMLNDSPLGAAIDAVGGTESEAAASYLHEAKKLASNHPDVFESLELAIEYYLQKIPSRKGK